jgi:hypothetical protein
LAICEKRRGKTCFVLGHLVEKSDAVNGFVTLTLMNDSTVFSSSSSSVQDLYSCSTSLCRLGERLVNVIPRINLVAFISFSSVISWSAVNGKGRSSGLKKVSFVKQLHNSLQIPQQSA